MLALAEVFLRRLDFGEDGCLLQRAEERVERLAGLKVERAVFDLQKDVRAELAVELREFDISTPRAVGINILVVNQGAPDNVAAVRGYSVGQDARAFGVIATVILGTGLAFGVG